MKKLLLLLSLFLLNSILNQAYAQTAPADYDKQCSTVYEQKTYWWGTGTCQVTHSYYGTANPTRTIRLMDKYQNPEYIAVHNFTATTSLSCGIRLPYSTVVNEPKETCTYQPRQPFTSISIDAVTCENGDLVGILNWSMGPGETFEMQIRNDYGGNVSAWASANWITYQGTRVTLSGTPYGSNDQHLDFRVRLSGNGKTGSWSSGTRMSGNCWNVDSQ